MNSITNSFENVTNNCDGIGAERVELRTVEYFIYDSERITMESDIDTFWGDSVDAIDTQGIKINRMLMSLGKMPVVLCIGTDRVTGDSLGPIVGQMLVERGVNAIVYGTLARPVTALTLKETIKHIQKEHGGKKVLAIDSSVCSIPNIGKIRFSLDAIEPGSADGKGLPKIGDVSVTANVTCPYRTPLAAVRLGVVYGLATEIVDRILHVLNRREQNVAA